MKIGIIGGGASGMAAALAASGQGLDVTILEKNDRIGKKILVTGNGKCNLSNLAFSTDCYHSGAKERLSGIFKQFTVSDTLDFFHELGLMTKEKNGYVYPQCEQASAVLDVLRFALERKKVKIETGCRITRIVYKQGSFQVQVEKEDRHAVHRFDRMILACGSRAGYKENEKADGLSLAESFQLRTEPFLPALVQLRCQEPFLKALAGVRTQAKITLQTKDNTYKEEGELQLTDYGISGIPVFQLSGYAVRALQKQKALSVLLDFLPHFSEKEWEEELLLRKKALGNEIMERFFTGTVHKKIITVLLKKEQISLNSRVTDFSEERLLALGMLLKKFPVTVVGHNSFSQAQVCSGGVLLDEVADTLECRHQKGLYLAGELLDVDGRCGGYNLQWAWTSGIIAGRNAAGRRK